MVGQVSCGDSILRISRRLGFGSSDLRSTDRCWRYDDFNESGRHVIDEAGDKPRSRQCGNRPEQSYVDGNRSVGVSDCFRLDFPFLYLKIVRQLGGVARKASDSAIGVVKYDEVKLPAAASNLSENLTDSP